MLSLLQTWLKYIICNHISEEDIFFLIGKVNQAVGIYMEWKAVIYFLLWKKLSLLSLLYCSPKRSASLDYSGEVQFVSYTVSEK